MPPLQDMKVNMLLAKEEPMKVRPTYIKSVRPNGQSLHYAVDKI